MNIIKFNNAQFQIESFSKTTYFMDGGMRTNADCVVKVDDINTIKAIAHIPITTIQIYHNDNLIYELTDISVHMDSVNEYFSDGDHVITSIILVFDNV